MRTRPRKASTWERLWRTFPEASSGPCDGCRVPAELGGVRSMSYTVQSGTGAPDRSGTLLLCCRCASQASVMQRAIRDAA